MIMGFWPGLRLQTIGKTHVQSFKPSPAPIPDPFGRGHLQVGSLVGHSRESHGSLLGLGTLGSLWGWALQEVGWLHSAARQGFALDFRHSIATESSFQSSVERGQMRAAYAVGSLEPSPVVSTFCFLFLLVFINAAFSGC